MSNYLSRSEAATYLRVSLRTLDFLVAERAFRTARIGKRALFTRAELDAFVESCRAAREVPG